MDQCSGSGSGSGSVFILVPDLSAMTEIDAG